MKQWKFSQSTGALTYGDEKVCVGYSGFGEGKCNPAKECEHNVGPIPKGVYMIGAARNTDSHGPVVMPLAPMPYTNTFGRSGFLIHGDSVTAPGTASHGCIILPRKVRERMSASLDRTIEVVG